MLQPEAGEPEDSKDDAFGEETLSTRVLLDKFDVGAVIGKGGFNIKKFREESEVLLDIRKEVPGSKERIATIKAPLEKTVVALTWMAKLINERHRARQQQKLDESSGGSPAVVPAARLTTTLLVLNPLVGRIIGKRGKTISGIREESDAEIKISQTFLPGSSEKTVEISGSPEEFDKAVALILEQLWQGSDRVTGIGPSSPRLYQPRPQYPAYPQYPFLQQQYQQPSVTDLSQQLGALSLQSALSRGGSQMQQTIVIPVPESLIGSVIGRHGSTVQTIRMNSGSNISIESRPKGTSSADYEGQRNITITGPAQNNEIAASFITAIVESAQVQQQSQLGQLPPRMQQQQPPSLQGGAPLQQQPLQGGAPVQQHPPLQQPQLQQQQQAPQQHLATQYRTASPLSPAGVGAPLQPQYAPQGMHSLAGQPLGVPQQVGYRGGPPL